MSRLLIPVLLALALHASAELPSYTLEDCLRLGFERAGLLRNARLDEQIAGEQIRQVRSQVYPQASLSAQYHRTDNAGSFNDGDSARPDNYTVNAELSQLLYAGGKVSTALEAARLFRDATADGTRAAAARLARDIHRGFHEVKLAGESARVAALSLEQLRNLVSQATEKFNQGAIPEFDLLSARVRLANERPNEIQARNRLELARASLAALLHLDSPDFELAGEPPSPALPGSLDVLTAEALARRPELAALEKQIALAQADIAIADSGRLPEVRAFTAYNGVNPDFYDPSKDAWNWSWQGGLRLSWSLFDGGLRRATVRRKELERERLRTDLDELRNNIRLEVRQAWLVWVHAGEALAGAAENAALAERAQQIAGVRQAQGLATYLEFTESNLALSTARLARYRALRARALAETEILYACGMLVQPPAAESP